MNKTFFNIFSILLITASGSFVFAEKMDLETHTVVINRLTQIVDTLDNTDVSKVPSTLRLADLLAERARLKNLAEVEKNCENCLQSKEDRNLAIRHYENIIPLLDNSVRGHAMLQKAHLHMALGHVDKAEKIHLLITQEGKKRHKNETLGQAHASLGDVYFQKTKFSAAKAEYEKALKIDETPQKGLVHYRLAWCLFNLDQVKPSIKKLEMILQTPQLTESKTSQGVVQDESFKIDVSKDLASFYARDTISNQTIQKLSQMSPSTHRMQNIYYLASEADRLGKKKEAALAWMFYLSNAEQKKEALEAQIRIMKLKRDTGDLRGSVATFKQVQEAWNKNGCGDKCEQLQNEVKRWIIDWNREEKKIQSTQLTQAYVIYTEIFPHDEEMLFLGATTAQQRKQYKNAFDFFRQAAIVSHANLNKKLSDEEKIKKIKTLNEALIGEMDMAETLKNYDLRMMAYQHYLSLNPQGERTFEVQFQIAKLYFEIKNFEKAASLFKTIATNDQVKSHRKEQIEAAHLSLNSLIQLKNDEAIENLSLEYANRFKEEKNEFYKIHRKSVLNTVAAKINAKKADNTDLVKLKSIHMVDSTANEKKSLYKNMYLLSLHLKNFKEALHANLNTLSLKDLSEAERNQTLQDRIWLAEMELDFKEAYQITNKLPGTMTAEKALKLVWLAEMASIRPDKHEDDFLKLSHNRKLRATVIARKIQRQIFPQKKIKPYLEELAQSPEVLAKLSLEIYSKNGNKEILEKSFSYPSVRRSAFAGLISRLLNYSFIQKDITKLSSLRLKAQSQSSLKKSLEERMKLLSQFEVSLKNSVRSKDLNLQAIFLNVLKHENLRLHNDLLALPVPKGLNKEQLEQYKSLVSQQAAPYKMKSEKVDNSLQALWSQSGWIEELAKNYRLARIEYKPALKEDLKQLMRHAPPSKFNYFQQALNEKSSYPSQQSLLQAQLNVRNNPFEESGVSKLKDIEEQRGNDFTVAHLEARLTQMKGLFR
jgi:hypothetical protein